MKVVKQKKSFKKIQEMMMPPLDDCQNYIFCSTDDKNHLNIFLALWELSKSDRSLALALNILF